MRKYIRHPTSIPIQVRSDSRTSASVNASNLSAGGLSFLTNQLLEVGAIIEFLIPLVKPDYRGSGVIVWRRESQPKTFEVGVRFANDDEYFRVRMVEQVCQIEEYRQRVLIEEGRELDSEAAAMEWIARFASGFDNN